MGLALGHAGRYHRGMLNTIHHGDETGAPTLLIAHGLYGSGRNWRVIAKRLSDQRRVVAVDMRNHGDSPWTDTHGYTDMANDLAQVIADLGGPVDVLGHSMGGKASMMLALHHGALVNRLVIADIAPVAYDHSQSQYIKAMRAVDMNRVERRADAEAQLAEHGVDPSLQSFFTQSLDIKAQKWRLNLDTLEREMPKILSFPEVTGTWDGAALFLSGAESQYVTAQHRPRIRALFPGAHFAKLRGAGHWLHAENPHEFEASVRAFLNHA